MKFMKKSLAVFLAMVMALCVMSVSAFAEDTTGDAVEGGVTDGVEDGAEDEGEVEESVISLINIDVDAPVPDELATFSYNSDSFDYNIDYYSWVDAETNEGIYEIYWDYEANEWVEEATEVPFCEGVSYNLCITLSAAEGFVFAEEPVIAIKDIVSSDAEIVENTGKLISFVCTFECSADNVDDGSDNVSTGVSFDTIIAFIGTLFKTIIRFFGAMFGIK